MEPPLDRSTIWPYVDGEPGPFHYARNAHPVGVEVERMLGGLDGGEALLFSSGMGATTAVVLALLEPGRTVVYDEPLKLSALREDLIFYPVPFDKIVAECCPDAKLRRLVKNMIYDGVLSHLLDIELGEMEKALGKQLGKKPKAMQLNMGALEAGRKYDADHLEKKHAYRVQRMHKTEGQILVEGNAELTPGRLIGHFGQVFFQTQRLLLSSLIRAKDCSILIVWRLCTLFIHRVIVVADRGLYFGYGLRLHVDLLRSSGRLRDMHLLFYTDVLAFHG